MLKNFFNWAAATPSSQYTLSDLVGRRDHTIKFNRAARFVERVTSVPLLVGGAIIATAAIPVAVAGGGAAAVGALVLGGIVMAFGKAHGLFYGGIAHLLARGASEVMNDIAKDQKPAAAPTPPAL